MVLVSLFAGQEERCRRRERTHGASRGRRGGDRAREQHRYTPTPCVKRRAVGSCCPARGAQLCAAMIWGLRWGWNGRDAQERGGICRHTVDSLLRTAGTDRTLWSNYTPIENSLATKECQDCRRQVAALEAAGEKSVLAQVLGIRRELQPPHPQLPKWPIRTAVSSMSAEAPGSHLLSSAPWAADPRTFSCRRTRSMKNFQQFSLLSTRPWLLTSFLTLLMMFSTSSSE